MPLTTAGLNTMVSAVTGGAVTAFSQANTRVGVGDTATAFAASQTDLAATTNKLRKSVTSLSVSNNVVTIVTDFTTAEANFTWAEWGTFNAASGGTMLTRKVDALGTKTSAQSWQLTTVLTFS